MKKMNDLFKKVIVKYGSAITAFALICVTMASNSSCFMPFYEPEEPKGLERFKKFN